MNWTCNSAGQAKTCASCAHSPANQKTIGQKIGVSVPKSRNCPYWTYKGASNGAG